MHNKISEEIRLNKSAKSKKTNRYILPILGGAFATLLIVMTVVLCIPKTAEFTPPAFEANAVSGAPMVAKNMGYTELYQDGMAYRVSVCGMPTADGNELTVYFTNTESNEKYLKLRVLDTNGNVLGETGVLKPNEYVKYVTLDKALAVGADIKLKIIGYEPESYKSAGSVSLNVTVGG